MHILWLFTQLTAITYLNSIKFNINLILNLLHIMTTLKEQKKLKIILTDAFEDYTEGLNSYAFFKLNDRALSEDLVQEAFMKTWRYLVKNGNVVLMKAFLYHILNGLIIDEYRKHKPSSLDVLLEKGFEPSTHDHERLFDILDGKVAILLIEQLPHTYQKVMRMRYIYDLSVKEMAEITGQSCNTVAVQSHRGLTKLKSLYRVGLEKALILE